MALKIRHVHPEYLAYAHGIRDGDTILSINGQKIRDFCDLQYYGSDYLLEMRIEDKKGKRRSIEIIRDQPLPLGIEPQMPPPRWCENNCVFCFIDQMPPGLRNSLYVKDDDYLYSRDFGNYITLTNLNEAEMKRIMNQHISPLYISVHTTDENLRQRMMGYKKDFDIMRALKRLSRAGIQMHTQIVCVPGYNDREELGRTIKDLLTPSLNVLSIGVVPVGLTKYRTGLDSLEGFDAKMAKDLIKQVDDLRQTDGGEIIYTADEFYVLSGRAIPGMAYYNDYPQAENGIGLLSLLRQGFGSNRKLFTQELEDNPAEYLLLHSSAATREILKIVKRLQIDLAKSRISAREIRNHFMGPLVNVSGLLTAQDILRQHQSHPEQTLILPANMFNDDELTLDGYGMRELKGELGRRLLIVDSLFDGWKWA
ncbi:MAG: DUF512 domain-containing protein [Candidatus Cloacimonetes bacterium]|nr:DUF512 domain-containing protein [Candidatus Cloacimonadota bacterium]